MGDIVNFPTQRAQGLTWLDRELRKLLAARGADPALVDFAATQLTSIYTELSAAEPREIPVALPEGLDQAARERLCEEINRALGRLRDADHALMVRLVARLVLTELRLFQHERGGS